MDDDLARAIAAKREADAQRPLVCARVSAAELVERIREAARDAGGRTA